MKALGLTHDEALRVFQTCLWLRLTGGRSLPSSHLKDFIVGRLTKSAPELASKVEHFTADQANALSAALKARQLTSERFLFA